MSKSLEEQIQGLRNKEEENFLIAQQNGEEYKMKSFEILEWEIREVLENEGILIRENPLDFPPSVQRKYFWRSSDEWTFPESVDPDEEWFEIPEGKFLTGWTIKNPYTGDDRYIHELLDIPKTPRPVVLENLKTGSNDLEWYEFSDIEIGDIITARVFDGNPYAQMVLQAKATEAMFRKMVGQGTPEDDAVLENKTQVMTAVNQIRALFSLSPM